MPEPTSPTRPPKHDLSDSPTQQPPSKRPQHSSPHASSNLNNEPFPEQPKVPTSEGGNTVDDNEGPNSENPAASDELQPMAQPARTTRSRSRQTQLAQQPTLAPDTPAFRIELPASSRSTVSPERSPTLPSPPSTSESSSPPSSPPKPEAAPEAKAPPVQASTRPKRLARRSIPLRGRIKTKKIILDDEELSEDLGEEGRPEITRLTYVWPMASRDSPPPATEPPEAGNRQVNFALEDATDDDQSMATAGKEVAAPGKKRRGTWQRNDFYLSLERYNQIRDLTLKLAEAKAHATALKDRLENVQAQEREDQVRLRRRLLAGKVGYYGIQAGQLVWVKPTVEVENEKEEAELDRLDYQKRKARRIQEKRTEERLRNLEDFKAFKVSYQRAVEAAVAQAKAKVTDTKEDVE